MYQHQNKEQDRKRGRGWIHVDADPENNSDHGNLKTNHRQAINFAGPIVLPSNCAIAITCNKKQILDVHMLWVTANTN